MSVERALPDRTRRSARALALSVSALLPIVVWPRLAHPFSTPKVWVLLVTAIVLLAATWRPPALVHRRGWNAVLQALPILFLASWIAPALFGDVVSFDGLLTAVAGGLWGLALVAARPRGPDLAIAFAAGGTGLAAFALAQWAGHDPFAAAGWLPDIRGASSRMRVYATLGNPDFAAAFLVATVPVTMAIAALSETALARLASGGALLVQLGAIAATGSRAAALGLAAAAVAWVGRGRWWVAAVASGGAAVVIFFSPARPLQQTIAGRLYVATVALEGAAAHPWVGYGPGGVEAHFGEWEATRSRADGAGTRSAFAGPQQHVHNDYLEALVERGVPGLLALLLVLAAPLAYVAVRGRTEPLVAGAGSSIVALAAVAVVDFPLARPAELAALWTVVAIVVLRSADDFRET